MPILHYTSCVTEVSFGLCLSTYFDLLYLQKGVDWNVDKNVLCYIWIVVTYALPEPRNYYSVFAYR